MGKCLDLEFKDYEILVLPDLSFDKDSLFFASNVKIIPTGDITPPYKRDVGAEAARGEILAFLDDDAYPVKGWLTEAIKIFNEDKEIGCVCGPAITPLNDSILQKASGLVYSSHLISGNQIFRYLPKKRKDVFDFPSCNFLIRKDLFEQLGGFDKPFWPGEDTFLCLKAHNSGKKMVYDPKVLVFHHRRTLFKKHLIQIRNYAFHRGYFAKKYPKTSLCFEYFIPSIFVISFMIGGVVSLFSSFIKTIYLFVLAVYAVCIIVNSFRIAFSGKESYPNKIKLALLTISGIIFTHFVYGIYFVKGLLAKKMPEET